MSSKFILLLKINKLIRQNKRTSKSALTTEMPPAIAAFAASKATSALYARWKKK